MSVFQATTFMQQQQQSTPYTGVTIDYIYNWTGVTTVLNVTRYNIGYARNSDGFYTTRYFIGYSGETVNMSTNSGTISGTILFGLSATETWSDNQLAMWICDSSPTNPNYKITLHDASIYQNDVLKIGPLPYTGSWNISSCSTGGGLGTGLGSDFSNDNQLTVNNGDRLTVIFNEIITSV